MDFVNLLLTSFFPKLKKLALPVCLYIKPTLVCEIDLVFFFWKKEHVRASFYFGEFKGRHTFISAHLRGDLFDIVPFEVSFFQPKAF